MSRHGHSGRRGPSQRQLRVGELIRRTLANILARGELHDPELDAIPITVGEVVCTADLRIATVHVMPLMGTVPVADVIAMLARHAGTLRHLLARDVVLRYTPELRFRADDTYDRLDTTRRIFADPRVQQDVAAGGGADGAVTEAEEDADEE